MGQRRRGGRRPLAPQAAEGAFERAGIQRPAIEETDIQLLVSAKQTVQETAHFGANLADIIEPPADLGQRVPVVLHQLLPLADVEEQMSEAPKILPEAKPCRQIPHRNALPGDDALVQGAEVHPVADAEPGVNFAAGQLGDAGGAALQAAGEHVALAANPQVAAEHAIGAPHLQGVAELTAVDKHRFTTLVIAEGGLNGGHGSGELAQGASAYGDDLPGLHRGAQAVQTAEHAAQLATGHERQISDAFSGMTSDHQMIDPAEEVRLPVLGRLPFSFAIRVVACEETVEGVEGFQKDDRHLRDQLIQELHGARLFVAGDAHRPRAFHKTDEERLEGPQIFGPPMEARRRRRFAKHWKASGARVGRPDYGSHYPGH